MMQIYTNFPNYIQTGVFYCRDAIHRVRIENKYVITSYRCRRLTDYPPLPWLERPQTKVTNLNTD
jgi:Xaa-Pro aminopeptidase